MARTTTAFAAAGLLLGALGAVGWHFQPVFKALGPPRVAEQVVQALGGRPRGSGPFYSGVVSYEEMSWWHEPSWSTTAVLVGFGAVIGAAVGAVLAAARHRAARTGSARRAAPTLVGSLLLGLLVGGGSALAWHWDPGASFGPWNGSWFWPVDVLYPIVGALLCLTVALVFERRRPSSGG